MRTLLMLLMGAAIAVPAPVSAKEAKSKPPVAAEPAPADDPADVIDVTSLKDHLIVVTDGKGHFVASAAEVHDEVVDGRVFYSPDGKTFWEQRIQGYGSNGPGQFSISFWEPRIPEGWKRSYDRNAEGYAVQCDDRVTKLTPVPAGEAKTMLAAAVFKKPRWKTVAYALARDDHGRYFFVDKPREPRDSKAFRVFMGAKNALKPLKMLNVVSDSQGDIFATRSGELRLLIPKSADAGLAREPVWIKGKKKTSLTWVPVEDNTNLIYTELGIYTGMPLGTACDDL